MTYNELKNISRQIDTQRLIVENTETEEVRQVEQDKLCKLKAEFKSNIDRIPNLYVKNIIVQKIVKGYSWRKIAMHINGKMSADCIRKTCTRYKW